MTSSYLEHSVQEKCSADIGVVGSAAQKNGHVLVTIFLGDDFFRLRWKPSGLSTSS
jgi:hypothetical protein